MYTVIVIVTSAGKFVKCDSRRGDTVVDDYRDASWFSSIVSAEEHTLNGDILLAINFSLD